MKSFFSFMMLRKKSDFAVVYGGILPKVDETGLKKAPGVHSMTIEPTALGAFNFSKWQNLFAVESCTYKLVLLLTCSSPLSVETNLCYKLSWTSKAPAQRRPSLRKTYGSLTT